MSTFNEIDLECEECGSNYRGTVWVAIHAGMDPELKDLLLGGELNLVSCPECGNVSFVDQFLIYQEPKAELIAYVYPERQRNEEANLGKFMRSGFREAQDGLPENQRVSYEPVLIFGLEGLVKLLHQEETFAEQSQIAQVLCKQCSLEQILLGPSQARRLKTMRVIPCAGPAARAVRTDILAGIDQLLVINPALDLYRKLKEEIEADPKWSIDVSLAKSGKAVS